MVLKERMVKCRLFVDVNTIYDISIWALLFMGISGKASKALEIVFIKTEEHFLFYHVTTSSVRTSNDLWHIQPEVK
jgi:hypothetical protein